MSYTELYQIQPDGQMQSYEEFSNAFRGAFLFWDNMTKRYLPGESAALLMLHDKMQMVWDLAKSESVPLELRVAMLTTFDRAVVGKAGFKWVAQCLIKTQDYFPDPGHIPAQGVALLELAQTDAIGACWNQTSVNSDAWRVYDPDRRDEPGYSGEWYNILTGKEHFFVEKQIPEPEAL